MTIRAGLHEIPTHVDVVVVGLGILIPLVVQLLAVNHRVAHTPLAPILVIAGGLALRFLMVGAGQASHWAPF